MKKKFFAALKIPDTGLRCSKYPFIFDRRTAITCFEAFIKAISFTILMSLEKNFQAVKKFFIIYLVQ